jgi:hypothetical protein
MPRERVVVVMVLVHDMIQHAVHSIKAGFVEPVVGIAVLVKRVIPTTWTVSSKTSVTPAMPIG